MKKILVPTDFSDTARGAFNYAHRLATYLGEVEIHVVHVYMPEVSGEYNFMPPMAEMLSLRENMLQEFIEQGKQELKADGYELLPMSSDVMVGFAVDELSQASKEYDLIVMGTTGEGGLLGKIFGSISTGTAQHAHCPVMLVPKDYRFQPLKHILYACNYESASEKMLEALKDFNRPFNANVHFIHVKDPRKDRFHKTREEVFRDLFAEGEPSFSFEITEVEGKTVGEGLTSYAEGQDIDLVIMVTHHRGIWDQIFHRSRTKEVLFASHIPTLVLHSD